MPPTFNADEDKPAVGTAEQSLPSVASVAAVTSVLGTTGAVVVGVTDSVVTGATRSMAAAVSGVSPVRSLPLLTTNMTLPISTAHPAVDPRCIGGLPSLRVTVLLDGSGVQWPASRSRALMRDVLGIGSGHRARDCDAGRRENRGSSGDGGH